ncbi:hypothetical protein GF420_11215 [candidate division GN15 bacterium]|nr:hypothetical protein [candidate division GN15 bacterium]
MKSVLRRLWAGWKRIALKIGRFNTMVLLGLFYFLILSPLGGLFRLFGWDPLHRRRGNRSTSWQAVDNGSPDLESLRRQS